jgi:hypothetical protein
LLESISTISEGKNMATNAEKVIAACDAEWDTWKSDCSGFAKAVGRQLGIHLQGKANELIDSLNYLPYWKPLGTDPGSASTMAAQGYFVIGGLKTKPNGHVVVVVSSAVEKHPVAYWGRLGSTGRKKTTVNWSWNNSDLQQVEYFAANL